MPIVPIEGNVKNTQNINLTKFECKYDRENGIFPCYVLILYFQGFTKIS